MTSDIPVLRVAVVGAGPAGIYAADALTRQKDIPVAVDVIDRLPTPFGLVRYGVAPDHVKIKSISRALQAVLDRDGVRFIGNVMLGRDVTIEAIRTAYDAVIWSYGAARDRTLDITGENLTGSVAATDMVLWYSGHPDGVVDDFPTLIANASSAVVIGVGNVAVDIARILAKPSLTLRATDMPEEVLEALDASAVTDIHVLGRRGPAQAKWTTKELRELGELDDVSVIVEEAEAQTGTPDEQDLADTAVARNVAVVQGWAASPAAPAKRRIHLHFWTRPVEIVGADGLVTGVVCERTARDASGRVIGTGETQTLEAQLVVRSVGYLGTGLAGLPFDPGSGTIPNVGGRVTEAGNHTGDYVAGWIKRGPTGVIGTNRSDATETVAALLEDAPGLAGRAGGQPDNLWDGLRAAGVHIVELDHWRAIDAAEAELGASLDRDRVKLHRLELLLAASDQ